MILKFFLLKKGRRLLRRAEIRDSILKNFKGNKSFFWFRKEGDENDEQCTHHPSFYSHIGKEFTEIEPEFKYLLSEGILEPTPNTIYIRMSPSGFSTFCYIETDGFVANFWRGKRNIIWTYFLGAVTIATFILVLRRDFFVQKPRSVSSQEKLIPQAQTAKLDTPSTKPDTTPHLILLPKDTGQKAASAKTRL